MKLKEGTAKLHTTAERHLFNQKLLSGELHEADYILYLKSQLAIFSAIEDNFKLPHSSLSRKIPIMEDLTNRGVVDYSDSLTSTYNYVNYIASCSQSEVNPHIYLNYMALMFGGSIISKKVKGTTKMYEFDDVSEIIMAIRQLQTDDWIDDVNKGFTYVISIFDEITKL